MSAKSPTAIFSPGTPMTPGASYVIDRDVDLSALHEHLDVPPTTTLTIASGVGLSAQTVTIGNNARLQLDGGHLECDSMSVGKSASIEGRGSISSREGSSAIFTTAPGALLDFTDIEVSLGSSGSLTAGAGTTLRLANRKLTTSVLSSPSGRSNIDAPERHVMNLNSFEGQWHSPQAFAQWFIEPTGEDWADAINNALTIDAEAVYLPGQLIRISKTIKMPCKSRLIGRTRGTTPIRVGNKLWHYYGTIIAPTTNAQLTQNLFILLNIQSDFFDGVSDYYTHISQTKNAWPEIDKYPTSGAEVADIRFFGQTIEPSNDGILTLGQQINHMRGIFVAGGAKFKGLVFRSFEQAIAWSRDYADCKHLERCYAQGVNGKSNLSQIPFAFDLQNLGDAAVVDGCQIDSSNLNGLRLIQCGGARISNNIFNADIEIRSSKGILYTGNHSENGAQLAIYNSSVEVMANYFEKGTRASILISSNSTLNSSVVTLSNNVYAFLTQRERYTGGTPSGDYSTIDMTDVSEYDIEVLSPEYSSSTLAAININNEMRYYIPAESFGNSVTTGINICRRISDNSVNPVKEFNNHSQFLSRDAKLAVLWENANYVQYPPFKYINIDSPTLCNRFTTKGEWYNETGMGIGTVLTYSYQLIYDQNREIAGPVRSIFSSENSLNQSTITIESIDKVIGFNLQNADAAAGKQVMVRLFRSWNSRNEYVDVPMCVASNIVDTGVSVNGYKWKAVGNNSVIQPSGGIQNVEFHGDNVTVWSSSKITNTSGWKSGDVIYNIGTDTSWTQQIIK